MTREDFVNQHHVPVRALFRACRFSPEETDALTREAFRRCFRLTERSRLELESIVRQLLAEEGHRTDAPGMLAGFIANVPGAISLSPPALTDATEALDPSARDALIRHYRQRASIGELSRRLKRSPGAVRQLLARARKSIGLNRR